MSSTSACRYFRQSGQGMTEYIIIVALVAVAAIGVYMYFGQTVRHEVAGMAQELAGKSDEANTQRAAAGTAATAASDDAAKKKGLDEFQK
jgi:hypothetical protein